MTLKDGAKFKGNLTCGLKKDLRNLLNFQASSRNESLEICTLMGFFCPKHKYLDEKVQKSYVS